MNHTLNLNENAIGNSSVSIFDAQKKCDTRLNRSVTMTPRRFKRLVYTISPEALSVLTLNNQLSNNNQ